MIALQTFSGSDGLVRSSPPSRLVGDKKEVEAVEEKRGVVGKRWEVEDKVTSRRGEGEEGEEEEEKCVLQEGERLVALDGKSKVQNLVETWHGQTDADGKDLAFVENLHSEDDTTDRDKNAASQVPDWSKEEIEKHSRRFNIDLVPRLLFARGEMVELLISSNISRLEIFHLDLVHVLCRQVYRVQGCDQGTDHAEWQSRAGSQLES